MRPSTTKEAWTAVKSDLLKQADGRVAMAKELQEHVERPLLDYREQQKLKRKDVRRPRAYPQRPRLVAAMP